MKTALIGATGFVGTAIMNELIARGHQVTAVVRNAAKVSAPVTTVEADVADEQAIAEAVKGHDVVISAYNPGWSNPNLYEELTKNEPAILRAVKASGVKRILFVGGAGTLFCAPGLRVVDSGFVGDDIMPGVKAHGEFYLNVLMQEKDIDWVFFSPAGLLEPGEATHNFRLGKDDLIVDAEGKSHINVGDYAVAMVDEMEHPAHHFERFTIGY